MVVSQVKIDKKAKKRWYQCRSRAVKKDLPYMTLEEMINFFKAEHQCEYCGVPNDFIESSLEIDRKDSEKGYTIDNIVFACRTCNTVKSNILTYEEMLEKVKNTLDLNMDCLSGKMKNSLKNMVSEADVNSFLKFADKKGYLLKHPYENEKMLCVTKDEIPGFLVNLTNWVFSDENL